MSDRLPDEPTRRPAMPPIAYPLLAFVFGGILVFSLSQILLAVPRNAAPAIGLLVALNVLVGGALIAYGGRVRRRPASFPLLVVSGVAIVAVGLFALGLEARPIEEAKGEEGGAAAAPIELAAKGLKFDKSELTFPAGSRVRLDFSNQDAGVQHNVAIFPAENPQDPIFTGDIVTGPTTTTYAFSAPAGPGDYGFRCDVHPNMNGKVEVTPPGAPGGEGSGGEGGGPPAGAPTVVAKNLQFDPADITVSGGGQVSIAFDNQDDGIPHNIHVFEGSDASGPSLFAGAIVTGPAKQEYTFTAPPAGSYFFHCDVHPTMEGTLTVT